MITPAQTVKVLAMGSQTLRRADASDQAAIESVQQAAYARNRELLGREPIPLQEDYADVLREKECWVLEHDDSVIAVLILEPQADHLLIWSVATAPFAQQHGLGRLLLAAAEVRAAQLALNVMRLYTGSILTHLVTWYSRLGYSIERREQRPDGREIVHMIKHLHPA